jgi:hypothetical protein
MLEVIATNDGSKATVRRSLTDIGHKTGEASELKLF